MPDEIVYPKPEDTLLASPTLETEWVEGDHPTDNPDGVTNSNHDYYPKTQEEKAELLGVEMVDVVEVDPEDPYPESGGPSEADRDRLLRRIHRPSDRVPGELRDRLQERQLAEGGAVVVAWGEDVTLVAAKR